MKALPLSKVYSLIEPGPVVLVATAGTDRPNVMTMSWHMPVEFEPPQVACIVSAANYSFEALRRTRECVIAIPDVRLAETVVKIGNCSGRDTDKLAAFGLATAPASKVKAPLVRDCFANLECRVVDTSLVAKFNLFVLEVVAAWVGPRWQSARTIHHRGWGEFAVDGERLRIKSRMR